MNSIFVHILQMTLLPVPALVAQVLVVQVHLTRALVAPALLILVLVLFKVLTLEPFN